MLIWHADGLTMEMPSGVCVCVGGGRYQWAEINPETLEVRAAGPKKNKLPATGNCDAIAFLETCRGGAAKKNFKKTSTSFLDHLVSVFSAMLCRRPTRVA